MEQVDTVEFKPGTKEELLPNYDEAFPCITTCCHPQEGDSAPWHWHQAVELFYMEKGCLEYITPSERRLFLAGTGGMVNSNVLHMTRGHQVGSDDLQVLHLFDPALIAGASGSRMEERYVLPLTAAPQVELVALDPAQTRQAEILELLRRSFRLSPEEPGYELRLRNMLSEIWLGLLETSAPQLNRKRRGSGVSERLKLLMAYINAHFGEKLSVGDLARAACISERACYELFKTYLRTTPVEYINGCRIRAACRLLTRTEEPVTSIAAACGMGSSSYFAARFRKTTGLSPLEYRARHKGGAGMEDML